ncbi:MAG: HEAT repeat domain-containing protein [Nitrospiraceae bacterium]|nr:HEAT repeat domain-containing protein [Nitrospiraceae bacterium]
MRGEADEIAVCRDVFECLANAFKTVKLYPGPNCVTRSLIRQLHENLCCFLDEYGEIEAEVMQLRLMYKGLEVYGRTEKTGNMAFSLFAAGIRGVTFRRGLEEDEIETFLEMLKRSAVLPPASPGWRNPGPRHIDFSFLKRDFLLDGAPGAVVARMGVIIRGSPESGGADEGPPEAGFFMAGDLPSGPGEDDGPGRSCADGVLALARAAMQRDNASGFLDLLKKLSLMASQSGRMRTSIQAVIGRLVSFEAAKWFLETSKKREEVEDYLFLISPHAADTLIELLGQSADRRMRRLICNVLALVASRRLEEFGGYLSDGRWYLVRNIVMVLGMSGNPAALNLIERAAGHPAPKVRRECVRAVLALGAEGSSRALMALVLDPDAAVRRSALRALLGTRLQPQGSVISAAEILLLVKKNISAMDFPFRAFEEKREFLEAFGFLGGQSAFPLLKNFFSGNFFSIRGGSIKWRELRAASAFGLAHVPLAEADRMLKAGARSRKRMLKTACVLSLELRQKRFFGGPDGLSGGQNA